MKVIVRPYCPMRILLYFALLVCFFIPATHAQELTSKNSVIDTHRKETKQIFDKYLRIRFENRILGTGSNNDSYFFPPSSLLPENYEILCYYGGTDTPATIFIQKDKIYYRKYNSPEDSFKFRKNVEINQHKKEAWDLFLKALGDYPRNMDEIKQGYKFLDEARKIANSDDNYTTTELLLPADLKTKILSTFGLMKELTPPSNEWKAFENIFSFLSLKHTGRYASEGVKEARQLVTTMSADLISRVYSANDSGNKKASQLYKNISVIMENGGTVYQLGYEDNMFGFCLPTFYYPPDSLPYLVGKTMEALRSYMKNSNSRQAKATLHLELDRLHGVLSTHNKNFAWSKPLPELQQHLYTQVEKNLTEYALTVPNRPLRSGNIFSTIDMPGDFPQKFDLLCHSYFAGHFSKIFTVDKNSLMIFELETNKDQTNKAAKEEIEQILDKLFIEQAQENDAEQEVFALIAGRLLRAKSHLEKLKPCLWKATHIPLSPKTANSLRQTWKLLEDLTRKSTKVPEGNYFTEYYPTFFNAESPLSYFQECLKEKNPDSPLINPSARTVSLLGYQDKYFGMSLPSLFYKFDEIPPMLNDVIKDVFDLKHDSSEVKQEEVKIKLKGLQDVIRVTAS